MLKYNITEKAQPYISQSEHYYSSFYRYSYTDEAKGKLKPYFDKQKFSILNVDIPNHLNAYRKQLMSNCEDVIVIEYTADKLIIGSTLSPYSGDAISSLHSIYGAPYIEGASIKGALRNCILQECDDVSDEGWFKYAFGVSSEDFENKYGQGNLIFFDSFPKNTFSLVKDIQTPHYPQYYKNEGEDPPTDDQSPNIFNFYVVKDTTFIIQIGMLAKSLGDKDLIKSYLKTTLEDYGLGGKKSVGYGLAHNVTDVSETYKAYLVNNEQRKARKKEEQKFREIQKQKEQKKLAEKKRIQEQYEKEQRRLASLTPAQRLIEQIQTLTASHQDIEKSKGVIYKEVLRIANEVPELASKLLSYWNNCDIGKLSKKQQEKIKILKRFL